MTTSINTQNFEYKGLEIVSQDFLIAKEYATTSARTDRKWTVDGNEAHTYKHEGTVYLAYYDTPSNKGGDRLILKGFNPENGFYIDYETSKKIVKEAGFNYEHFVSEL